MIQLPKGSTVQIAKPTQAKVVFIPDRPGFYRIELIVTNARGAISEPYHVDLDVMLPTSAIATGAPVGAELATKRQRIDQLYRYLFSRTPDDTERTRALETSWPRLTVDLFRRRATWQQWIQHEAEYLDLTGDFAPASTGLAGLAGLLANDERSAKEGLAELLLSPDFARRYPNPTDQARVILQRLLGYDVRAAENQPRLAAATTMCSGKPAELDGESGQSLEDLVRIAFRQQRFLELYLERHFRSLLGKAPQTDDLTRWCERFRSDGREFVTLLADWIEHCGNS
jgi:hypothetical protein